MDRFSRKSQVPSFMKILPSAAELFHVTDRRNTERQTDRQTDIQRENAKLRVAFRNFAREPTNSRKSQYCCRAKRNTRIPIRTLGQAGQVELSQFSSNTKFDFNYTFYFSELTFNVHVRTLTTS